MTELLCDLGECDHSPMKPPRANHHGEEVFAENWRALMAQTARVDGEFMSNGKLYEILRIGGDDLVQRMATVAATFVTWLGTNCGRDFLRKARKMGEGSGKEDGSIAAWAVENKRCSWLNSGFRAIEHILAPDDCRENGQMKYRPELSVDDYETVEAVVYWLGTGDGARFTAACEKEIAERILAEEIGKAVGHRDFKRAKQLLASVGEVQA